MHFQPSNRTSDNQEKRYHPTAAHEGNLDVAVEHAFSVRDTESRCHGKQYHRISPPSHVNTVKERSLAEDETFFSMVNVTNGLATTRKRSLQSSSVDATAIPLAAVPNLTPDLEREVPYPAKRQRLAEQ